MISRVVQKLGVSSTLRINQIQQEPQHRDDISLGFGVSPFPPPSCLVKRVREFAARNEYLPTAGLPSLRAALAQMYSERYGHLYLPEHVLVGPGSKQLMYLLQSSLRQNVHTFVTTPAWVSYAPQCRLLRRKVRKLRTTFFDGWRLTPQTVAAHFHDDPSRPRLLILNAPCNPTGASYSRDQVRDLANSLRNTNTIVLLDEIYADLTFDDAYASLAQEIPEQCIIASGISKALSAGGYRLGYMVFPPKLAPACRAITTLASETHSCAPSVFQYAYDAVLRHHAAELAAYQAGCRRIMEALCAHAVERFRAHRIRCVRPQAAWYLLLDFINHKPALSQHDIYSGQKLCDEILRRAGVIILFDRSFTNVDSDVFARVSLVDFDGGRSLANLPPANCPIDAPWLQENCPRVLDGVGRICQCIASLSGCE